MTGKFVCFIMFRSRSAISILRVRACDSICTTDELFAISTTRECRLKCMSLAINVQSSVTKRFYQEAAIRGKQSTGDLSFAALRLKNCDLCVNAP